MSGLPENEHYQPLRSFTGTSQHGHNSMADSSNYMSFSGPRSSYGSLTDSDLEEARHKLLAAQYEEEAEPEVNSVAPLLPPTPEEIYQDGVGNGLAQRPVSLQTSLPLPSNNDNQSRISRYGSVTGSSGHREKRVGEKRYRLPLLILLGFDWGMVVFLSIICFVLQHVYDPKNPIKYWELKINEGFFDLVIIATFRTVCNILAYNLMGWVTRTVMAFTTLTSACYVPVKTYFLLSNVDNTKEAVYLVALILLVFVCFIIPWFIAFFFEFKYLPAEKARLDIPTWWSIKPWIWPRAYVININETPPLVSEHHTTTLPVPVAPSRRFASTMSLDFRTPMGSSRASPVTVDPRLTVEDLPPISEEPPSLFTELASPECDRNLSPEDQLVSTESQDALEQLVEMTRNNDGWTFDKTVNNIKCYTKQINGRKILKLDSVIEISANSLFTILYPGDRTHEWNPSCIVNETVHRVDQIVDIVYTVSAAMGPVSSRDFVSARRIAHRDGTYYMASKSIVTDLKPEQSGKVRGENGACGYVIIPMPSNRSQFIWVYNSNLKGWLPQTVVDQTVSTALCGAYQQLQVYVRQEQNRYHS